MEPEILRTWSARATPDGVERYLAFFADAVAPALRRIDGFLGATVSTRLVPTPEGEVAIDVVTAWRSLDAVARFAGAAIERAVVEPEARACLAAADPTVAHHRVRARVPP